MPTGYSPDQVPEPETTEMPCPDCGQDCGSWQECDYIQRAKNLQDMAEAGALRREPVKPGDKVFLGSWPAVVLGEDKALGIVSVKVFYGEEEGAPF